MPAAQESNHLHISNYLSAPNIIGSEISPAHKHARQTVEAHLGAIVQTEVITGGLVSHVYKITGEKQKGIVKIRGTHLAKLPHIPIDPKDLDYEWEALQTLSLIEPTTFPQPLALDREASMILMTDVIPKGKTLETRLEAKEVTPEDIKMLGNTVARVHRKLAPLERSIRVGGDERIYKEDLRRRLGYQEGKKTPALDDVFEQLDGLPKQLILGDLSPKNIGQGEDGNITICDLESFYRGNILFAYGYLAGHILLHNLNDPTNSEIFLSNLLSGYQTEDVKTDFNSMLLKKVTLGALLYRLARPDIPYNISLSAEERSRKTAKVLDLLKEESFSWKDLIRSLVAA